MGILDLMGYVQKQGEAGRERGQQSYLGKLAGQAYGAAPDQQRGIVQQAITTNPDAGFSLAGALGKAQDRDFSQLGQAAAIMSSLPEDQKAAFYSAKVAPLAQQAGYPVPGEYDPRFQKAIDTIAQRAGGMGNSSELQTFGAMTQGMSPEDVQKARRIQLGLDPRAVTAAAKSGTFRGADGRERPTQWDPTSRQMLIYDDAYGWVPLGDAQGQQSAPPAPQRAPGEVPFSIDPSLPPQVQAQIRANPDAGSAQGITSLQTSFGGQPQQAGALPPPLDYQNGGQRVPGLGVGRSPEEQAALTTSAQEAAKLTYLPTELGLRTQADLEKAAGTGAITRQNEVATLNTARSRDADKTLNLLSEAESLLNAGATGSRSGAIADDVAAFFGNSTTGAKATAALKTIAGQLTSSMPRMQGPQSDKDVQLYKEMAGDLANDTLPVATRLSALRQIRKLNEKYSNGGQAGQPGRASQSGSVDDLLGKYGIR